MKWLVTLAFCLTLLTACGEGVPPSSPAPPPEPPAPAAPANSPPALAEDERPTVLTCRIVDGAAGGDLLLAELGEGGTGVYRLNAGEIPVTLDGEPSDAASLEDGMPIDVAFNGEVLETYPAQLGEVYSITAWTRGQERNLAGTEYDLCGLYLQVLDDLWKKDPALNENITLAGLDLSEAPGELTESEKAAIAWRFGEQHGVEVVTGTWEELKAQGYFTATSFSTPAPENGEDSPLWYQWEDGCLFSIRRNENHDNETYTLPVIFFDAEKWRTPLASYCFYDCSAMWGELGTWTKYNISSEMIS